MGADREILVGTHAVVEALRAGRRRLDALFVAADRRERLAALIELARTRGLPAAELPAEELERRIPRGERTQGVLLECGALPQPEFAELLSERPDADLLLASDGVEDPQNFGSLLRVADTAGVRAVLTTRRRAPPLSPAVARASAGAVEHVPVVRVSNLARALRTLREHAYWVVAADAQGDRPLYGVERGALWTGSVVVVVGAEGRGVRPGVLGQADEVISIPLRGAVESLNVGTAAAVVLFELQRVRSGSKPRDSSS